MTPLDFAAKGSCASLKALLTEEGFVVQSVWAMEDTLDALRKAPSADVNLVIPATGLRAAKYMQTRFSIPWVAGLPIGSLKNKVVEALRRSIVTGQSGTAYSQTAHGSDFPSVVVIGEPVAACSLAAVCEGEGETTCVLAATEESEALIREGDRVCRGEEEVENALAALAPHCRRIIADPMYQYVCPDGPSFTAVPHLAFSGRIYRRDFRDFFRKSVL
jgi:hypothetical protein